jgi:hypothetical protein
MSDQFSHDTPGLQLEIKNLKAEIVNLKTALSAANSKLEGFLNADGKYLETRQIPEYPIKPHQN